MANRMILNETAWFGRGAVGALTDEVIRRGYRKALIVTDKNLVQCGVVEKVTSRMDAARWCDTGIDYRNNRAVFYFLSAQVSSICSWCNYFFTIDYYCEQ